MIAGCYSTDFYCENADEESDGYRRRCPASWDSFPDVFTGETWGECIRVARRAGWLVTRERYAYCPACSGKKRKIKPKPSEGDS